MPPPVLTTLEVDNHETPGPVPDSADIAIATGLAQKTTAESNSYRTEQGRRYHAFDESQYWLPNDDEEVNRLDIQHICHGLALGTLFLAPISADIRNAVDIGTGSGLWALEFARKYPHAKVFGLDLSPVQHPVGDVTNCEWITANAEEEWKYPEKMDYIHSRMLLLGIHDWPRYFKQAFDNLVPGGWVEVLEPLFPTSFVDDGGVTKDSALYKWSTYMQEGAAMDGIDTLVSENKFQIWLEEQGFLNIHRQHIVWPTNPWAKGEREKKLGLWAQKNTNLFLGGSRGLFIRRLGWTEERFQELIKAAGADLDNPKSHYFVEFYSYYAQKPE